MKTIRDLDLNNKKVLIRCDFNVPIKDGKIIYHDNCYHQMRGTTHPMGIITVSELQLLYKIHSDKEIKNYIF